MWTNRFLAPGFLLCQFFTLLVSAEEQALITHTSDGVTVLDSPWWVVSRSKRQYDVPDMNGFNIEQKRELLNKHNELRATRSSSDMMRMSWSSVLERSAQDWANRCVFAHSATRDSIEGFTYVGENLYAGTASFEAGSVVQMWFDEWRDYSYNTLRCVPGKMCGHYTQVVWAESKYLGCGVRYCHHLSQVRGFNKGYNVVCHYGPGGNIIGFKPFKIGLPCSQCSAYAPDCYNGLCYDKASVDEEDHLTEDRGGGNGLGDGNSGQNMITSLWRNCLCTVMALVLVFLSSK